MEKSRFKPLQGVNMLYQHVSRPEPCLVVFILALFCLSIGASTSATPAYAGTSSSPPPLTAHGNYQIIQKHGGLAWTSDAVLGRNILVINSYHEGDDKTDSIMKGVYESFNKSEFRNQVNFFVEYMDSKRYSYQTHLDNLKQVYKYKYANKQFDVIIVTSDEALDFLLTNRDKLFYKVPIVFTGISNKDPALLETHEEITGVIEIRDIVSTIDLALKIHPQIEDVILLSPGKYDEQVINELQNIFPGDVNLIFWFDQYLSNIENKIKSYGSDSIIIPISEPRTKSGTNIPYKKFVNRIVTITDSPVYGIRDTALKSGAIGGKLVSSYTQGQAAAKLAMKILNGNTASKIPIVNDNSTNRYMFDYNQLNRFDIKLADLPSNSIIINKPYPLYNSYKHEINLAIILLLLQTAIICLLVLINKKRKIAEKELKIINDQLEKRVDERTADLSSANLLLKKEIKDRIQTQQALSISEEKFSKAFHSCPDVIVIINIDNDKIIDVNDGFELSSGYDKKDAIGSTMNSLNLFMRPDDYKQMIDSLKLNGKLSHYEIKIRSKSGEILDVSVSAEIIDIYDELHVLAIARDITLQKIAERELRRYEHIFSSTKDFMAFVDRDYIYRAVNNTYLDAFKVSKEQIVGHKCSEIIKTESYYQDIKPCLDQCLDGKTVNFQHWIELPTGRQYHDVLLSPYYEENEVIGIILSARDLTTSQKLSEQLVYQASHDSLTGLINRHEFETRLQRALDSINKSQGQFFLCYMDLDQFKIINDTCGHAAGDELLRQLGQKLKKSVRERDTLARLGGDEFAALIENCSLKNAQLIVSKLQNIINNFPFEWGKKKFRIGVSIGLVPINRQSGDVDKVLKQADAACYVAKKEGRNRMRIYYHDDERLLKHHSEMQLLSDVQEALEKEQFCLYKQAIIPLDNEINIYDHYEILVRMVKGDSLVTPEVFLPSAEQYGLSSKLDTWIIGNIFKWLATDLTRTNSLQLCTINISGYSLADTDFLDFILEKLGSLPHIAPKICFEITETAAIANYDKARRFISVLKSKGCHFALDDFGSGFSSFAYLKNLQVDFLKIDGMFTCDILDDPMALSMVKSINEIGHILGTRTIAEFVENNLVLQKLREIGVDYAQGYAIGKPCPIDEDIYLETSILPYLSSHDINKLRN